ncbi:hypothetical protein ACWDV7_07325 [Streptomyces sp. NPDC003362]
MSPHPAPSARRPAIVAALCAVALAVTAPAAAAPPESAAVPAALPFITGMQGDTLGAGPASVLSTAKHSAA